MAVEVVVDLVAAVVAAVVVLAEVEAVDGGRRGRTLAAITRVRRTGEQSYEL